MGEATGSDRNTPFGTVLPPDVAGEAVGRFNDIVMLTEAEPLDEPGLRILYVNPAFERLTGYSAAEALGRSPRFLQGPKTSSEEIGRIEAALRARQPVRAELLNYRKDGSTFWIEVEASFMRRPTTGDELFLFIERDITERKLLVSQVVQSQRLESIGTLAGGIAHDLNNILAPIMMAGDLLEDRIADPEASQLLGLVKTNSRRGAELVRQILMFARGMEGPRVAVEATELIDEIRTFLAETLPKSIRLRVAVSADVKPILGDPSQLHQLLLNLCVNARDAMPSGGSLVISATPAHVSPSAPRPHPEAMPGDFIRLDIADSGSGIPDILKGQIFDPFFTTKGVGHGSGLGLSSARTIVKAHGGFMSFVSKEGLGTTFSIFLPAAAADVPRMPLMSAGNAGIAPARGNGERILVVDDEDSVRQIMRSTLEHFGFQVFASSEGAEALDLVRGMSERFALAIVDSQMPGMDGAQTIAALRGIEPELPVIISSGFAQDGNRRGGGAKATRHFLEKPFSVETLVAKVHEALGMPAA